MSTDRDVTGIVRSWLEEGVTSLPDRVLDAVLDQVPATRQRRAPWPVRRLHDMNSPLKFAVAVAAVVLVAVIGITVLPGAGIVGGPTQTMAPSPSPTPSPTPSPAALREGPLPAGSYSFKPFAGPGGLCAGQAGCVEASAADDSVRMTVTLPDGWAGLGGTIIRAVESYSPPGGAGLVIGRGGWLYSQPCGGLPPPDVPTGTTVDEFVTALVDHPDLDVTSPVDVSLGGYSGKYLELRAPANTTTDELGPKPGECNFYFVWEPGIYAQGPNALWRIWVLDVDGIRAVVRADSFPGTTSQVQAQLASIVESIQIEP